VLGNGTIPHAWHPLLYATYEPWLPSCDCCVLATADTPALPKDISVEAIPESRCWEHNGQPWRVWHSS